LVLAGPGEQGRAQRSVAVGAAVLTHRARDGDEVRHRLALAQHRLRVAAAGGAAEVELCDPCQAVARRAQWGAGVVARRARWGAGVVARRARWGAGVVTRCARWGV